MRTIIHCEENTFRNETNDDKGFLPLGEYKLDKELTVSNFSALSSQRNNE